MEKKNNPKLNGFGKKQEKAPEKVARKPLTQKAANFAEYEAMMNEKKKAEKKAAEEKLTEQRMEEYTFKGTDLKSVTDSFIAKMSSLSSTMSSVSGFDMKA